MKTTSLPQTVEEHLALARTNSSGRSAITLHGGRDHHLRQTILALRGGSSLGEHESPGEATLQVLTGHVKLIVGEDIWEGRQGDYVTIPSLRHSLDALEDSAIVLTVVTGLTAA